MLKISRESEINIINMLIDQDIISGKDLPNIKKVSKEGNKSQIDAVFELKLADENRILEVLVKEQNLETVDLSQIPITEDIKTYHKIINFYSRHFNYMRLEKQINKGVATDKDKIINTIKWIYENIKKPPNNLIIVDNHPWTIVERRFGLQDQFSDLLSVLLVYSKFDAFYHNEPIILTFLQVEDNKWTVIDPYYGILFINNDSNFATVDEILLNEWRIVDLNFNSIDELTFNKEIYDKFVNFNSLFNYYNDAFKHLPSSDEINSKSKYERKSRSYSQNPIGRLFYQLYIVFNN